jgi:hypothetical protein
MANRPDGQNKNRRIFDEYRLVRLKKKKTFIYLAVTRDSYVIYDIALQHAVAYLVETLLRAERSRVLIPMKVLDFSIDLILPAAL